MMFPISFILFAPYTESLFLLWTALFFLSLRVQHASNFRWVIAGLAGALATLTRQQGLFLVSPMAWDLWMVAERDWRKIFAHWPKVISLAMIPFAMMGWIVYRVLVIKDAQPDTTSFYSTIVSTLIAPSSANVVPTSEYLWPWDALKRAIMHLISTPTLDLATNMSLALILILLLALAWKFMTTSYRLYCMAIFLVGFSYYTGSIHPYMGLPRHIYLAFPIFIGAAPRINHPWMRLASVALGVSGNMFMIMQYVLMSWVP